MRFETIYFSHGSDSETLTDFFSRKNQGTIVVYCGMLGDATLVAEFENRKILEELRELMLVLKISPNLEFGAANYTFETQNGDFVELLIRW